MDQQDGISRRDAVIGVSFLGVLMAALSATIVYRIVESRPQREPRQSAPLIVEATIDGAPTPPAATMADGTSIDGAMIDGNVATVSHQTPAVAADHQAISEGATPTFVAPSAR